MAEEMSPTDLMAIMNNGGNAAWNNNPFLWLIFLAMMGNGNFGGNWGNNMSGVGKAELADGLNNQTVLNDLRNIETGIAGVGSTVQATGSDVGSRVQSVGANLAQQLCSGLSNVNATTTNGFNNLGLSVVNNANAITNAINQASASQQIANCNLSHAIQDNKYEMAQNTTAITNAIRSDGDATRKLLTEQQIQDLRDSKEAVQRDLQSAQLTLANSVQTNNILNTLGRFVPYTGCGSACNNNGF